MSAPPAAAERAPPLPPPPPPPLPLFLGRPPPAAVPAAAAAAVDGRPLFPLPPEASLGLSLPSGLRLTSGAVRGRCRLLPPPAPLVPSVAAMFSTLAPFLVHRPLTAPGLSVTPRHDSSVRKSSNPLVRSPCSPPFASPRKLASNFTEPSQSAHGASLVIFDVFRLWPGLGPRAEGRATSGGKRAFWLVLCLLHLRLRRGKTPCLPGAQAAAAARKP